MTPAPKKNEKIDTKPPAKYFQAVGRRKTATAQARIWKGKGELTINGQKLEEYFPLATYQKTVLAPFEVVQKKNEYDASIKASGGGKLGQAEATRHAITRALLVEDEDRKPSLRKAGFVTRDDREKERKKYGLKGARRAPQFSKR
jgi:small subunit ribosomal protein S9